MNGAPRRYLVLALLIVLAPLAAWYFFPRRPYDVGVQLARSGDRTGAIAVWERACDSGDIDSCAHAAIARVSRGEVESGRALFAKAKAASPKHVWVLLLEGSFLELDGRPNEAKALYEEAERLHPDSGMPATSLAKLALAHEDFAEAERCTERAIAAEPTLGTAHAMRGRVLVATSSLEQGMASFYEAFDLGGMAEVDWVMLAEAVGVTKRESDKLEILEVAAAEYPDSHVILVPLGVARRDSGNIRGAVDALRLACDTASDDAEPRIILGELFLRMGNAGFAVPRLEEALKISPRNVDAAILLATAWATMEEREKALALIADILGRKELPREEQLRALYLRASVYQDEGNAAEAMADARSLLALDPAMPEANWLVGHIELEAGHLDESLAFLQKATEPGKVAPIVVLQDYARVAVRQGRLDDAVGLLESMGMMNEFSPEWIKANPEFRALERNERFRLLMEGASAPRADKSPDAFP